MLKKNLFVLPNDSLGGAENVLRMVALETKLRHNESDVFFLSSAKVTGWAERDGFTGIYSSFGSQYLGILSLLWYLLHINTRYHYAFSSHVFVNGILGVFRKLRILKTDYLIARESTSIFARYAGIKLLFYKLFYYLGYSRVDLLICQSIRMEQDFKRNLSHYLTTLNVVTLPNPFMYPVESVTSAEEYELINYHKPYIISAGRLIPEKGFDLLIEAFVILSEKYPNHKLIILGDGEEKVNLQELLRKYNLEAKVFLPGHIKDVYPWFKSAEVCVVSSRIEGFPNVLLQMMSQNGKVVSTLCAGGIENIKNLETAEVGSVESLVSAIRASLERRDGIQSAGAFQTELKQRSVSEYLACIKHNVEDYKLKL